MPKPAYLTATVRVGGRKLTAEYRLHRGHEAPHVGPDSPRYLEPGVPDRVEVIRLLMGRVELDRDLEMFEAAEYQIVRGRRTGGAPSQSPGEGGIPQTFSPPSVSFHHEKALRIGERVLANRERRVRDERDQGRLL